MSKLLEIVTNELDKRLAEDIKIIDFRNINPFSDYSVICSISNNKHAVALVKYIKEVVLKNSYKIRSIEGEENSDWILIDLYDVVVHVFVNEARYIYQLEKLWGDLPTL